MSIVYTVYNISINRFFTSILYLNIFHIFEGQQVKPILWPKPQALFAVNFELIEKAMEMYFDADVRV